MHNSDCTEFQRFCGVYFICKMQNMFEICIVSWGGGVICLMCDVRIVVFWCFYEFGTIFSILREGLICFISSYSKSDLQFMLIFLYSSAC